MGAVYLAKDAHSFDREVVIKVPHLAFLGLPRFRQRFQEEVKRLIQLEHPGIVSVYDVGQRDNVPYAVLQYLRGGSLEDFLAEGQPAHSASDVLTWLPGIASALDFIHECVPSRYDRPLRRTVPRTMKKYNVLSN